MTDTRNDARYFWDRIYGQSDVTLRVGHQQFRIYGLDVELYVGSSQHIELRIHLGRILTIMVTATLTGWRYCWKEPPTAAELMKLRLIV